MAMKRITKELTNLQHDPPETCTAGPANKNGKNSLHWIGTITGPPNTPYAEGVFNIDILFPEDYPRVPPELTFTTPIFHPNISLTGEIRLAELEQDQWSPAITIRVIMLSLQAMLSDPNPLEGCILNEEAAKLYLEDVERFREKAQQWTVSHALQ